MPLIIGITGSIATGKSTACSLLADLGARHCDADRLVHRMYDPGKPAFDRIVNVFGGDVVGEDGFIDRKVLGSRVFGRPQEMKRMTDAIGNIAAEVKRVVDDWNSKLAMMDVAVLEAVNLIEAGYGQWCHRVWLFACDDDTARARLTSRNGFSEKEADQRLSSQRPWEQRASASDKVFHNDGTPEDFRKRVLSEFDEIRTAWEAGSMGPSQYESWWQNQYS